jgi:hypothetical protein
LTADHCRIGVEAAAPKGIREDRRGWGSEAVVELIKGASTSGLNAEQMKEVPGDAAGVDLFRQFITANREVVLLGRIDKG